ncbi:hypothetical protein [Pelagibius sp. 7325]|uniref:hypothetical protein n=1 Tax=Pelagibius sp. 7325 TaxID=3131994 RepID=UPI0030EC0981
MVLRTVLAVVLAGAAGVLANAAAAALFVNPMLWQLAGTPNRYLIGIALAVLVPLLYRVRPGAWGAGVALLLLTLLPSLATKLALGAVIAWPTLLALNFTYALAVLVVYRVVAGTR